MAQAQAKPADELIALINAYRGASQFCEGRTMPAASPLAPDAALASIPLTRDADLNALLKRSGYSASRAQAVVLSGPRSAKAAMGILRNKYCDAMMSAQFSQIGIARDGSTWRLVFAQPLITGDLGGWHAAGQDILAMTNAARAVARTCGAERYAAAPPLAWDPRLASAARAHSEEMARRNYFSHTGKDGMRVDERASRAGYAWQRIGENIATGQGSAEAAVAGWLASPTHCANLMNAAFVQMGAAYAVNPQADTGIYWTQVFGTPR